LLLLKDKTPPALSRKNNNQNLLSNLVLYSPLDESMGKKGKKGVNIPLSNISGVSPLKRRIS
jgi:hypothetical protein